MHAGPAQDITVFPFAAVQPVWLCLVAKFALHLLHVPGNYHLRRHRDVPQSEVSNLTVRGNPQSCPDSLDPRGLPSCFPTHIASPVPSSLSPCAFKRDAALQQSAPAEGLVHR